MLSVGSLRLTDAISDRRHFSSAMRDRQVLDRKELAQTGVRPTVE
jgi:hypothetical protein